MKRSRMLPRQPFSLGNPIGAAMVMIACFAAATTAVSVYVPFLITSLHGISELVAGLIIALEAIAWTLAALLISGQPERRDRFFILAGMTLCVTDWHRLPDTGRAARADLVCRVLAPPCRGFGFGLAWTFILRRATSHRARG